MVSNEGEGRVPIVDSAHCNRRTCCCRLSFGFPATVDTVVSSRSAHKQHVCDCVAAGAPPIPAIARAQRTLLRVSGSTSHILLMMAARNKRTILLNKNGEPGLGVGIGRSS